MEKQRNSEKGLEFLKSGILSLTLFLITYFVVVFVTGLSKLYIAYDFDIPATLYLHDTVFHIPDNHPLWTRDALTSVLMAAPVSSFALSIGGLFMFIARKKKTLLMLYSSIWLLLQSFNMTFGLISENIITHNGITRIAELQGLGKSALLVCLGMSLYFMFHFGAFTSRLLFAHSSTTFRYHRYLTVINFFFLPWLLGNLIILLPSYPDHNFRDLLAKSMMLVMLLPAFFVRLPEQEPAQEPPLIMTFIMPLLSLGVVWISIQLLRNGISF